MMMMTVMRMWDSSQVSVCVDPPDHHQNLTAEVDTAFNPASVKELFLEILNENVANKDFLLLFLVKQNFVFVFSH